MFSNAVDPYRGSSTGVRNYIFSVPGIQFVLTVGKIIDVETLQTCFNGNPLHPIFVTDLASPMMEIYRTQTKKAHRSKKLLEYLAVKKKTK